MRKHVFCSAVAAADGLRSTAMPSAVSVSDFSIDTPGSWGIGAGHHRAGRSWRRAEWAIRGMTPLRRDTREDLLA